MEFAWDEKKHLLNIRKHGVDFFEAQLAFTDPKRIIVEDDRHSTGREVRFFCFGKVNQRVLTVRFTYRDSIIRIFGAAYWRQGKKRYETKNGIL